MEHFIKNYYVERRHTNSLKWDKLEERFGAADLLPLWVADMDFKVSSAISEALSAKIEHGVFGYSFICETYLDAFKNWMKSRFEVEVQTDWLRYTPGVVQALYHFMNAFTQPDDAVIILTPVYYPFHYAIKDTGRKLVTVDLIKFHRRFEIDFQAFEQAIIDNQVKAFIHCSPHNPVGRVWTLEEQLKIIEICQRHHVLIISDEIHQDFVYTPYKQHSILSIDNEYVYQKVIAVTSASKTFNLAGLTHSILMIPNEQLREEYDTYLSRIGQSEINLMGAIATEAGYTNGGEWLSSLLEVIQHNYTIIKNRFAEKASTIEVMELEGTYLALIDLSAVLNGRTTKEWIQERAKLAIDFGEWFGVGFENYIRINLATKPELIEEAVKRILETM